MYVCDFRPGHTWLPGKIVKCFGPVSYKVQFDNDQIVRRHQDYLQKRSSPALIMTEETGNILLSRQHQDNFTPYSALSRPIHIIKC